MHEHTLVLFDSEDGRRVRADLSDQLSARSAVAVREVVPVTLRAPTAVALNGEFVAADGARAGSLRPSRTLAQRDRATALKDQDDAHDALQLLDDGRGQLTR